MLLPYEPHVSEKGAGNDLLQPTVGSYFEAFSPVPNWDELGAWPPDVFALSNLVLDHTEAYRSAVSPEAGRRWPPKNDWNEKVRAAARNWRATAGSHRSEPPDEVRQQWQILIDHRGMPLIELRYGRPYELCSALLTLHAMADQSCQSLISDPEQPFERRAWRLLAEHGSLSRISPARIRILPKTHIPRRGITIRSFSRYLALSYEPVGVRWRRFTSTLPPVVSMADRHDFNVVLLPWPFRIESRDFRPVSGPLDMDPDTYGFFEFAPRATIDIEFADHLLETARARVQRVDALILPEAAVEPDHIPALEGLLAKHDARYLFAGVRERASEGGFGRNYVHLGVRTDEGWECYEQTKHNRWCLDEGQIRQYHLTRVLEPTRLWWEAIDLPERNIQVLDVGGGATTVPLICEDLARLDEVSDLLRRLGPTVIIAVLLDGPQLASRWPGRYTSVFAEDPGSAVLTLTSAGMAARSRLPGKPPSRTVALWSDPRTGLHELELARGSSGILLTASEGIARGWTADGRHHDIPELVLAEVCQLRIPTVPTG